MPSSIPELMLRLTSKQRRFAEKIAAGYSLTEAYRQTYNCRTAKPSTIRTEASRLANDPKIVAAIEVEESHGKASHAKLTHRPNEVYSMMSQLICSPTEENRLKAARLLAKLLS